MANIHAIYPATEGEGVRIGIPQVFVRFQGCAVGCVNCDSPETWNFKNNTQLAISEIVSQIKTFNLDWTSITGGNPLDSHHRSDVLELIVALKAAGQKINIEVTGLEVDVEIFSLVDFISFDIKTPSTGVSPRRELIKKFIKQFGDKSQLKAVIQDEVDFEFAYQIYNFCAGEVLSISWVMTPACSANNPLSMKTFEWILEENQKRGAAFRVVGQQHKWVFGQDRRDV